MNQDHTAINPYDTLPQVPWEQWWSPDHAIFPESSEIAGSNVYAPEEPQFKNHYTYEPEYSTQWVSSATPMQGYPVLSLATESNCPEMSTAGSESRRGSSSTQADKRKRKRNTNQPAATKSTRRRSTEKKEIKMEDNGGKSKTRSKAQPAAGPIGTPSPNEDEDLGDYSRRVQERNRIASNKFRVKKREDAKKLIADEENMERANRDLSSYVSGLTLQVYQHKMWLLQHTDCDYYLIQGYIVNEAHRYIHDLDSGKQPPHHPPEQSR
jgi:hypothetical protein